ncbi:MAG: hypothetical protein J6X18_07295 [Bacteroidales bacterium]|nr:hypothetical protein [Bacteroidales bacterium]
MTTVPYDDPDGAYANSTNIDGEITLYLGIPQGNPGHNPNRGTYVLDGGSPSGAPLTGNEPGDFIVVLDTRDTSNVTGTVWTWDTTNTQWVNQNRDSNMAYFATGELVAQVPIDDTHLDNPADGALAKAEDVAPLKVKLADVNISENKATITFVEKAYVSVTSTGVFSITTTTTNRFYAKIQVSGYKRVRFLGIQFDDVINMGYGFFDSQMEPIEGTGARYDIAGLDIITKEYDVIVPPNATYFCWTTKPTTNFDISSQAYAWLAAGKTITEMIEDAVAPIDDVKNDVDEINEAIKEYTYSPIQGSVSFEDVGYFINSSGNKSGDGESSLSIMTFADIDDTDKYVVSINANYGSSSGVYLVHYFNGSTWVGKENYIINDFSDGNVLLDKAKLTIPEGTDTIKINVKTGVGIYSINEKIEGDYYDFSGIEDVPYLKQDVDEIKDALTTEQLAQVETFDLYYEEDYEEHYDYGFFVKGNGSLKASANFNIRIYEIDENKLYKLSTSYDKGSSSGTFYVINYFNGESFLGGEFLLPESGHLEEVPLTIPSGTTHIWMNVKLNSGNYSLLEVTSQDLYDFDGLDKDFEALNAINNHKLRVTILENDYVRIRSRFDDNNDILVNISYSDNAHKFNRNSLFPRHVYIGNKNYDDATLMSNSVVDHNISDSISTSTLDWCGPIYANHGYCTPTLKFLPDNNEANPITSADIGSVWEDNFNTLQGSPYSKRRYLLANKIGDRIYLLPLVYLDEDNFPHRDWVFYNSPMETTEISVVEDGEQTGETKTVKSLRIKKVVLADKTGECPLNTEFNGQYARFDYQVQEVKDIKLSLDGISVPINELGTYYCKKLCLGYKHLCYDASKIAFQNRWNGSAYTIDFTDAPLLQIFDRQFIFICGGGSLSYTLTQKMNVLEPYKIGESFSGNPVGRYIGTAPTAFLKPIDSNFTAYTYIPKLVKQYPGVVGKYEPIDFTHEFVSDYKDTAPAISITRNNSDCADIDNMPERLVSYLIDTNGAVPFGFGGGHSLVRGASQNSVRNTMIDEGQIIGWWNPPVSNKTYLSILRHGNDSDDHYLINDDYLRTNEGYFCWFKPQVTNSYTGAAYYCFWYNSGDEYIVYIHTKGMHDKNESVILPSFMDGMTVQTPIVERKNNNIQLLDDIVVSSQLHISVSLIDPNDTEECNYIVVKVK